MKKRKRRKDAIQVFRLIVLAFFILLVTILAIGHQLSIPGFGPIDALCPFGGLETIYMFLAGGGFLQRIFTSNIVLLAGIIILGIVAGRYFCGWICMLGGLQEYFRMLGKKIFKKKHYVIPERIDNPLRYTKYVVLFLVLFLTWRTGELIIRPYDPFVAYAHLASGLKSVWDEFAIGLIILVVSLIASMFYDRVFCKYLCPLGAFLGLLTKIGIYRIKRENNTCTDCKICDKACPVNLNVSKVKAITSPECINCLECVTDCPTKKNTLIPVFLKKISRPAAIAVLGIVIYTVTIGASKITGYWESAYATLEERAEDGDLSPDDIKGSNTISEVVAIFGLDVVELYDRLDLDMDKIPESSRLRDIKLLVEEESFEAEEVRAAVREMLGLPAVSAGQSEIHRSETETELPVENTPDYTLDDEYADEHNEAVDFAGFNLEGTMTILTVANALGISAQEVIEKLELPESIPQDQPLREMQKQYGYSMPELKQRMSQ